MPASEPSYWTAIHRKGPRWWGDSLGNNVENPDTFRPPIVSTEFSAAFDRVMEALSSQRAASTDALTEAQFIEAMRQALACGDFMRHISMSNDGQAMSYVPFREHARMKARIDELEKKLAAVKAALEPFYGRCD